MTPSHIVAVSALIVNREEQVLMIRSPKRGWETPGGQVEEGETLIEALHREIYEEAGVMAAVGPLVGVYSNVQPPAKVIFGFRAIWVSGELVTSSESLETEWVQREHVLPRITHAAVFDRTKDMLSFNNRIIYRVYTVDPYQVLNEHYFSP